MSAREKAERLASSGGVIANLRRENAELRKLVNEYAGLLVGFNCARDEHYGFYVGKSVTLDSQWVAQALERTRATIFKPEAQG